MATLKLAGFFSLVLTLIATVLVSMTVLAVSSLPPSQVLSYIERRQYVPVTLYAHDLHRDVAVPLTDIVGSAGEIAWSPDGDEIAYSRHDVNVMRRQIHIYSLETGQSRQITSGKLAHTTPDWSPDGKYLVYQAGYLGNADSWDIYLHELESDEAMLLYDGGRTPCLLYQK